MKTAHALRLGRSHFIFIAALLAGSALILTVEAHDPDGWGKARTNAYAGALAGKGAYRLRLAPTDDEGAARAICRAAQAQGIACTIAAQPARIDRAKGAAPAAGD